MLFADVPFFVYDLEGEVVVGSTCFEGDDDRVLVVGHVVEEELGCGVLVYKVWVEHIKLIPLNNLWWWIVSIIMSLVVLVPFEAGLD